MKNWNWENAIERLCTDFVVLRFRELHHELGDLVLHVHFVHDRSAIVCDGNVTVGTHHDLVESWGTDG